MALVFGSIFFCYELHVVELSSICFGGAIPFSYGPTKLVHFHWLNIPPRIVAREPLLRATENRNAMVH